MTRTPLQRRPWRTAALLAATVLAAGCGRAAEQRDPRDLLMEAARTVAGYEGVTLELRVDSDEPSLLAAFAEDGISADVARRVLTSSVRISGWSGQDRQDPADDEAEVVVRLGDVDAFALRSVGEQVYVRADVEGLLRSLDTDGAARAGLAQLASQAELLGIDIVDEAVSGRWLHVTGGEELAAMLQGMGGAGTATPGEAELDSLRDEVARAVMSFLDADLEVVRVGRDDAGEHLRATASGAALFDLAGQILDAMGPMVGTAPGVDPRADLEELRREAGADAEKFRLPVDVWVERGAVTRLAVDVLAVAEANDATDIPEGVGRLAFVVDLAEFHGGVNPPADAVEVDLMRIVGTLMGAFMGGAAPPLV